MTAISTLRDRGGRRMAGISFGADDMVVSDPSPSGAAAALSAILGDDRCAAAFRVAAASPSPFMAWGGGTEIDAAAATLSVVAAREGGREFAPGVTTATQRSEPFDSLTAMRASAHLCSFGGHAFSAATLLRGTRMVVAHPDFVITPRKLAHATGVLERALENLGGGSTFLFRYCVTAPERGARVTLDLSPSSAPSWEAGP